MYDIIYQSFFQGTFITSVFLSDKTFFLSSMMQGLLSRHILTVKLGKNHVRELKQSRLCNLTPTLISVLDWLESVIHWWENTEYYVLLLLQYYTCRLFVQFLTIADFTSFQLLFWALASVMYVYIVMLSTLNGRHLYFNLPAHDLRHYSSEHASAQV